MQRGHEPGIIPVVVIRFAMLVALALFTGSACIEFPPEVTDAQVETQGEEPLETYVPGLWLMGTAPTFEWWRFGTLQPDGTGAMQVAAPAGPQLQGYWNCAGVGSWRLDTDATIAVSTPGCFSQAQLIMSFLPEEGGLMPGGALERAEVKVVGSDVPNYFGYRFPDDWCDADMNCPDPAF